MKLHDHQQRIQALDPARSFIVQAPAGSGKTTLLTQRYLTLLASVHSPEEILAITFTKKASAEMQNRILESLEKNDSDLAKKALLQDEKNHWQLLKNPNRLHIKTIDAFCFSLASQMPTLSQLGGQPIIKDDVKDLYQQAAHQTLKQLKNTPYSDAIKTMLLHLDNQLDKATSLLVNMLAKRDQWMPHLGRFSFLTIGLEAVNEDAIEKCRKTIPADCVDEILTLARYAANHAPDSQMAVCRELIDSPNTKNEWLGIAELFLTKENNWRKNATLKIGFPAPNKEMKNRYFDLLSHLSLHHEFLDALIALRNAPNIEYAKTQKNILEALLKILPICVANLKIIFSQTGTVDYIEMAQAASRALGENENPTDLALSLDYKIKHILVDEFQDTSISQFQLLEKLTAGWQQNDGRTLFCVGDPMQSIYRFRNAEVGLFLRAQQEGIGHIELEKITLTTNFRSGKNIVNWINTTFEPVFPTIEDVAAGAVKFSPSVAYQEEDEPVHLETNLQSIIPIIQRKKQNESLAILVRARSHLADIIPLLRKNNINYQAVEIDRLSEKPCIQDLLSLTKALLHLADRTAWLSLLRAPWCGLTLDSLHQIATIDQKKTIYESMSMSLSNQEEQKRLMAIKNNLDHAFAIRLDQPFREWIESTWRNLKGHLCLSTDNESLNDVEVFFDELEKYDMKNLPLFEAHIHDLFANASTSNPNAIQLMTIHKAKGLEFDIVILPSLERTSRPPEKQLLRWMERPRTHRENDLILAPIKAFKDSEEDSINEYLKFEEKQKTRYENQRLFYVAATRAKKQLYLIADLHKNHEKASENSFLSMVYPQFLPLKQINNPASSLIIDSQKKTLRRLKSVECAPLSYQKPSPKYYLYNEQNLSSSSSLTAGYTTTSSRGLTAGSTTTSSRGLTAGSSINLTLDTVDRACTGPDPVSRYDDELALAVKPQDDAVFKFLPPTDQQYVHENSSLQKNIGTMIHRILQQIATEGLDQWSINRVEASEKHWEKGLIRLGVLQHDVKNARNQVLLAIKNTLNDEKGRWILSNHSKAQSELPITIIENNQPKNYIIDRTFVDENGIRWIIDFKCSNSEPDQNKLEQYQQQLKNYRQIIQQLYNEQNIQLALYFPLSVKFFHEC